MKAVLTAGLAGVLFSLGLGLAGMTDPARILGFLDPFGAWDPSLMFVMMGAMGTYALLRRLILKRPQPVLAASFPSGGKQRIDRRLVGGSALFGIGWGIAGYCPGPAFTSMLSSGTAAVFVAAMGAGMVLFRVWERMAETRDRTRVELAPRR